MENIKEFSLGDIELFKGDENVDFAIAEVYFLSSGNNAQNCPISEEVLRRDANTALGKPIVAKFHKWKGDVGGHEADEVIVGWIPESSEIEFKEKDGKLFAVAKAVISKLYGTDTYLLFKKDNLRSVSSEFSAYQPNANELGEGDVEGFAIRAVTILGKTIAPAVEGANIKMLKFSEKDANDFYSSQASNELKRFAESRKEKLGSKIKKKKLSNNKEEEMADIKTFAVDIGNLWGLLWDMLATKYPDVEYGSIYRIDGIYKDDSGMFAVIYRKGEAEKYKLKFDINGDKIDFVEDIVEVKAEFVETDKVKSFEADGETKYKTFEKEIEDVVMAKDETKEDEAESEDKEKDEDEKEMGCHSAEFAKDEDKVEEPKEEDKKFSLDSYADSGAILAMLETETAQRQELAKRVLHEMSADEIVTTFVKLAKERDELKEFKDKLEEKEKKDKLFSIITPAKECLSIEMFTDLYDEGRTLALSDLDGFANKVKAFMSTHGVQKTESSDDGIMKFASHDNKATTEDAELDVFEKIKRK